MKKILLIPALALCIWGCKKQQVSFTANPFNPPALLPATFTAHPKTGTSYQWNFGDGSTASGPEVSHTFYLKGLYR